MKLDVYVENKHVGCLYKNGDFVFEYDDDADENSYVSLVMPVFDTRRKFAKRKMSYKYKILHPPLAQSLPEGYLKEFLLEFLSKQQKLGLYSDEDYSDLMLLGYVGRNQIGRVRIVHDGMPVSFDKEQLRLSFEEIKSMCGERRVVIEEYMKRLGLFSGVSGVQPKVLAEIGSQKTDTVGVSVALSDYIVKFSGELTESIAVNEYFCMQAVRKVGLRTAECLLNDDGTVLLVKRFDIGYGFEDFCSLLGVSARSKYRGDYFIVGQKLASLVSKKHRRSDVEDYFTLIVLSTILRNGDAHLKNFGVLYTNYADVRLSPAYDVVTTAVYLPEERMALSVINSKDWPTQEELLLLAAKLGIPKRKARQLIDKAAQAVIDTMPEFNEYIKNNTQHYIIGKQVLGWWVDGLNSLSSEYSLTSIAILHDEQCKKEAKKGATK